MSVTLYSGGVEKMYINFNGQATDKWLWFSSAKVTGSTSGDESSLMMAAQFALDPKLYDKRHFLIHDVYNGCDADKGFLVVVDSPGDTCPFFAEPAAWPRFFYSNDPYGRFINWLNERSVADVFIVFVKY